MRRVRIVYDGTQGMISWNKKRPGKFKVEHEIPSVRDTVSRFLKSYKQFDNEYSALPIENNKLFEIALKDMKEIGIMVKGM